VPEIRDFTITGWVESGKAMKLCYLQPVSARWQHANWSGYAGAVQIFFG